MVPDNTAFSSDSKNGGIGVKDYPISSRTIAKSSSCSTGLEKVYRAPSDFYLMFADAPEVS